MDVRYAHLQQALTDGSHRYFLGLTLDELAHIAQSILAVHMIEFLYRCFYFRPTIAVLKSGIRQHQKGGIAGGVRLMDSAIIINQQ